MWPCAVMRQGLQKQPTTVLITWSLPGQTHTRLWWGLAVGVMERKSQAGLPGSSPTPSPAPPVGDPLAGPRVTPHPRPDRSQRWWGHGGVTEAQQAVELDQPSWPALPRGPGDGQTVDTPDRRVRGVSGTSPHAGRARPAAWLGPSVGRTPGRHCLQRGPEPGSGLARPGSTALLLLVRTPACAPSVGALRVWQLGEPAPRPLREGVLWGWAPVLETPAARSAVLPGLGQTWSGRWVPRQTGRAAGLTPGPFR